MKFNKYKLGDLCDLKIGRTPPRKEHEWFSKNKNDYKWVSIKDMGNVNKYISDSSEYLTEEAIGKFNIPVVNPNTILLSFKLTVGKIAITTIKMTTNEAIAQLPIKDNNLVNNEYLYYYLSSYPYESLGSTSSIATAVNSAILKDIIVELPNIEIQGQISRILKKIDDKIELNNKINKNLEEQAYQIYAKDIMNLNSKITKTLDEFCDIFTGKRNANEAVDKGLYNFYTCAPEVLKINSYIFDGPAIIISGNGAYTGRTSFYSGKFDLYQRTYACTIKKNVNEEYIYLLYWIIKFELANKISGGTHGSAIPYIVFNDLAKYSFSYDKKVFDKVGTLLHTNLIIILKNNLENEKLSQVRNYLLPKLMSGEIDVSKIDI